MKLLTIYNFCRKNNTKDRNDFKKDMEDFLCFVNYIPVGESIFFDGLVLRKLDNDGGFKIEVKNAEMLDGSDVNGNITD